MCGCRLDSPRLVFDPSIYGLNDLDSEFLGALEVASEYFQVQYPGHSGKCPVITCGDFQVNNNFVAIENTLFDSGALQASYISKEWVDKHREHIQRRIRPCRGRVRMADNKTVVEVHEHFRTLVTFTIRGTGEVVAGVVDFWILDMPGPDSVKAIIGLPDILKSYLRVFVSMLEDAAEAVRAGEVFSIQDSPMDVHLLMSMSLEQIKDTYPDLVDTWSKAIDDIAPEELETEDPCSFTDAL